MRNMRAPRARPSELQGEAAILSPVSIRGNMGGPWTGMIKRAVSRVDSTPMSRRSGVACKYRRLAVPT
ncbi:hypothetical protein MESS4_830179 [Mesorhizobium sp. STM 4661]|nr:hypothetical protein MESS4_830179 [Mesorhizobium sp. STM 4661]